jgi:LAO/AO transport system kinase
MTNPHPSPSQDLLARALRGDRVALARAISRVEDEAPGAVEILESCFARSGRAVRVGITGPPGAGKSTLCTKLAQALRRRGARVAIVAVDPTSPFSGGALLGDRVRMAELAGDEGVFIRSMASRGSLGGLAVNTAQVCDVLDAAGFETILIETVGVGQSELEVARTADTTVVVLVPESGDGVQAMKAGLMEIGDVFVVNKADREGAERAAMAIKGALELKTGRDGWPPPVLTTVASTGQGVEQVAERVDEHLRFLRESRQLDEKRRRRVQQRLEDLVRDRLWRELNHALPVGRWDELVQGLAERRLTPYEAAEHLMRARAGTARVAARPRKRALRARRAARAARR